MTEKRPKLLKDWTTPLSTYTAKAGTIGQWNPGRGSWDFAPTLWVTDANAKREASREWFAFVDVCLMCNREACTNHRETIGGVRCNVIHPKPVCHGHEPIRETITCEVRPIRHVSTTANGSDLYWASIAELSDALEAERHRRAESSARAQGEEFNRIFPKYMGDRAGAVDYECEKGRSEDEADVKTGFSEMFCPFCGGSAGLMFNDRGFEGTVKAGCSRCAIWTEHFPAQPREDDPSEAAQRLAIAAWNRRPDSR